MSQFNLTQNSDYETNNFFQKNINFLLKKKGIVLKEFVPIGM